MSSSSSSMTMTGSIEPVSTANQGLLGFPTEVIAGITKYLPQSDKYHLALTCSALKEIALASMYGQDELEDHRALAWACAYDRLPLLNRLLGKNPNLSKYRYQMAHYMFVRGSCYFIAKELNSVTIAIRFGSAGALQSLLQHGADPNQPDPAPVHGHARRWFPINWAVLSVRPGPSFDGCLRLLQNHGANINQAPLMTEDEAKLEPNDFGIIESPELHSCDLIPLFALLDLKPPSHVAAAWRNGGGNFNNGVRLMFNSRLSKVTSLLERGANPNIRDPHTTHTPIFHLAAALEAFQTDFYFAGWCPVLRQDVDSLYQEVIVPYALEFLKLLVKHGADPTIPCEGTTALHLVCKISSRYESIINMLLKSGADINAPNSNGETPIFSMVDRPPGDMKKLVTFMYKGAKCNHQNHDGRTPMHAVILNNGSRAKKQSVIRTLINFGGADASIKDNNGESPADVGEGLRVREWFETLDMLRFAEENPQARALTDDDLMDTRYRKNRRSD